MILGINGVTHDERVLVYNVADLLVYPSSYDGFGMPVLEAQRDLDLMIPIAEAWERR